jgi:hypothetical protein
VENRGWMTRRLPSCITTSPKQIVDQIVKEPIAAGGTMSDVMMLCESVLVGVVLGCLPLGHDVKVLDLIVGRVKERLARVRLEDLDAKGNG